MSDCWFSHENAHFSFQIFTCVVAFGLFHGLTFLPVVLSLIGPEPYDTSVTESDLKQYTDLTYRNGEISLNDLKKSKGVKMDGDIRKDVLNSNNQINEGFNDLAAEFDSSPVSKPFAFTCMYVYTKRMSVFICNSLMMWCT